MTPAARAINDALAMGVSPLLKAHGFRKVRRHYSLLTPTAELQISAQASQWNHDRRATLTFNLGVVVPAVQALMGGLWEHALVTAVIRIGHLLPKPEDFWWELAPGESNMKVALSMRDAIADFGLPWLHELATLEGLKRRAGEVPGILHFPSLAAASAALLLGERAEASAIAREYIAHPGCNPEWGRQWAAKNGVEVT